MGTKNSLSVGDRVSLVRELCNDSRIRVGSEGEVIYVFEDGPFPYYVLFDNYSPSKKHIDFLEDLESTKAINLGAYPCAEDEVELIDERT